MRRAWAVLTVGLVAGCGGADREVELVVPDGFTGTAFVVLDRAGQDLPAAGGRCRVEFPAGGVLRVRSFRPLEGPHVLSARRADGSPIPVALGLHPGVPPELVAVRAAEAAERQDGARWYAFRAYFVGTAEQKAQRPAWEKIPGVSPE